MVRSAGVQEPHRCRWFETQRTVLGIDVSVRIAADADLGALADGASRVRRTGDELSLTLPAGADVDAWLSAARDRGAKVVAVTPRHETLEDLFMRQIATADTPPAHDGEGRP